MAEQSLEERAAEMRERMLRERTSRKKRRVRLEMKTQAADSATFDDRSRISEVPRVDTRSPSFG